MTYIDYLNAFSLWLKANTLPATAQLMYFKLLLAFNEVGWPEDLPLDNLRLQEELGRVAKTTVIAARGKLTDAGLISFQKGRKGAPNRYRLLEINPYSNTINATINPTTKATANATESATISNTINATHIKNKIKIEKEITPTELQRKVFSLPLNDGSEHDIYDNDLKDWEELYPAVDVQQQLRNMKGWLVANPNKRKTKRGINKFINSWLAKEQDRGGGHYGRPFGKADSSKESRAPSVDWDAAFGLTDDSGEPQSQ